MDGHLDPSLVVLLGILYRQLCFEFCYDHVGSNDRGVCVYLSGLS